MIRPIDVHGPEPLPPPHLDNRQQESPSVIEGIRQLCKGKQKVLKHILKYAQDLYENMEGEVDEKDKLHRQQVDQLQKQLETLQSANATLKRDLIEREKSAKATIARQEAILEELKLQVLHDREIKEALKTKLQSMQQRLEQLENIHSEYNARRLIGELVGFPVEVQIVLQAGEFLRGKLSQLPRLVLGQMQWIKEQFVKHCPNNRICKIEYIMNDFLFHQFDFAKKTLQTLNRPAHEKILFHGTPQGNIKR